MNSAISLRTAAAGDIAFLKSVYFSTRQAELAVLSWDDSEKTAFLEMQFRAQDTDYHANYPDAAYDVVVHDGVDVGRLYVHRQADSIAILDIALLPEHRGAGIGSALLHDLIAESDESGKPLVIYVEKYNRARNFYDRLGFVEVEDAGFYWRMARPARSP